MRDSSKRAERLVVQALPQKFRPRVERPQPRWSPSAMKTAEVLLQKITQVGGDSSLVVPTVQSGAAAANRIRPLLTNVGEVLAYVPEGEFQNALDHLIATGMFTPVSEGGRLIVREAPHYLFGHASELRFVILFNDGAPGGPGQSKGNVQTPAGYAHIKLGKELP